MYENEKMPLLRKKNFIYLIVCKQKKSRIYLPKVRKESKVAVDKKVILFFIVAVVISLAIMAGWILAGLVSNPLGILLVAIPLIILRQLLRTSFTMSRTRNTVSLWRQKSRHRLFRQSSYLGT